MFQVLQKKKLAKDIYQLDIEAPEIAKKAKAGQFIILRIDEKGERIPLTIADMIEKRDQLQLFSWRLEKQLNNWGLLIKGISF